MKFSQRLHLAWLRFWCYYPKCIYCNHSLYDHVSYDEPGGRLGVCVNPCCIEPKCNSFNMPLKREHCSRCGAEARMLYENDFTDEETGEKIHHALCWDCDFDVMNGGDLFADAADIDADRAERAYEYDPINNPRPY